MNILVIDGDLSEGKIKNAYRKGNCETLIRFNILAKSLEIRWPKAAEINKAYALLRKAYSFED